MEKYKITYQGKGIEIERLPNGKFKIPPLGQLTKQGLGSTWLDDCRIPYGGETPNMGGRKNAKMGGDQPYGFKIEGRPDTPNTVGRFPANLLVSDDVLNDGQDRKSNSRDTIDNVESRVSTFGASPNRKVIRIADSGSFSRYFDLDKWWEERIKLLPKSQQRTYPFAAISKASKSEKNRGLDYEPQPIMGRDEGQDVRNVPYKARSTPRINQHPCVKPVKLMSYLITLGSCEGGIILDPFLGSGTTAIACEILGRNCIGYEIDKGYFDIAIKRVEAFKSARN